MCRNKKIIINIGQICNCTYLQNAKKQKWTACKIKFMTHSENNKNSLYSVDLNMKTHFSTGCQYTFNSILTSICWSTCNNQLVSITIFQHSRRTLIHYSMFLRQREAPSALLFPNSLFLRFNQIKFLKNSIIFGALEYLLSHRNWWIRKTDKGEQWVKWKSFSAPIRLTW